LYLAKLLQQNHSFHAYVRFHDSNGNNYWGNLMVLAYKETLKRVCSWAACLNDLVRW